MTISFLYFIERQYKSVEDVAAALKSRHVRGALVDVYTAASRSDLFKHADIVAKKNIRYPNYFGLVLSGDMKNAASAFRSYINENADKFLGDMRNKTSKLEVCVHRENITIYNIFPLKKTAYD